MPSLRKSFDALLERRTAAIPTVSADAWTRRLALVGRHGDFSLAYSTAVQDDLSYFGDASGYIAFGRKMGSAVALADPVAEPAERPDLIRRFVEKARDPCFVQIGESSARVLSRPGLQGQPHGHRHAADAVAQNLRRQPQRDRALFRALAVQERLFDRRGRRQRRPCRRDQAASDAWRSQRIVSHREMRFLNRPFRSQLRKGMRRFMLLDPRKQPVAILDFDPMVENGELAGYTTSFKRKLPGITAHAEIGLTKFAADRLRDEGRKFITLGLSPLAGMKESGFPESRLMLSVHAAFLPLAPGSSTAASSTSKARAGVQAAFSRRRGAGLHRLPPAFAFPDAGGLG